MKAVNKCEGCQNLLAFKNGYAKCGYCGCEYGEKRTGRDWEDISLFSTTGMSKTYIYPNSSTSSNSCNAMYVGGSFTSGNTVYF